MKTVFEQLPLHCQATEVGAGGSDVPINCAEAGVRRWMFLLNHEEAERSSDVSGRTKILVAAEIETTASSADSNYVEGHISRFARKLSRAAAQAVFRFRDIERETHAGASRRGQDSTGTPDRSGDRVSW